MKLTILSTEGAQDSEFRSFFGRIQDTIICFRDLLTFNQKSMPNLPRCQEIQIECQNMNN
jgi:hypothetical protein